MRILNRRSQPTDGRTLRAVIGSLFQDGRQALRHLRRTPGFACAAVATLGLAVGANTAVFAVLDALLWRKLPVPNPDSLVSVASYNDRGQKRYIPFPLVVDVERDGPFHEVCGYNGGSMVAVEGNGRPAQATVAFVSGNCFAVFGVTPLMGRPISNDDAPLMTAGRKVAVISHRLWQRTFDGDAAVLGRVLKAEGVELAIIGVLPPGFHGVHVDHGIDVFAPPDTIIPASSERRPVASEILGRLPRGVSLPEARAQVEGLWKALLLEARRETGNASEGANLVGDLIRVEPAGAGLSTWRERYAPSVRLILVLTSMLLLLACVNIASLMLTRVHARESEISVRRAMGATPGRIAQHLLSESLLLSIAAVAVALPVMYGVTAVLASYVPVGYVERSMTFTPGMRSLAVAVITGGLAAILLTALPAWVAARRRTAIRIGPDRTVAVATSNWARALLVAQVALSCVLTVGAGLLLRSVHGLQTADVGVRVNGVLNAKLLSLPGGRRPASTESYYAAIIRALEAEPGVRSVALAATFPRGSTATSGVPVAFVGEEFGAIVAWPDFVSERFFETVGIRVLQGRSFAAADDAASLPVAVVSESLAGALAPGGDVLNRRIRVGTSRDMQDLLVVGVVANATRGNPRDSAPPLVYRPHTQRQTFGNANVLLAVDGHADVASIAAATRRAVAREGREYVHELIELDALFARSPSNERMSAALSALIGAVALALSAVGLYGVLAYSVTRRSREIGVRLALGARPVHAARGVVFDGLTLIGVGLIIGVPAAYGVARAIRALLYGVAPSDAVTFGAAVTLILGTGVLATVIPARRAASIDPVLSLRGE